MKSLRQVNKDPGYGPSDFEIPRKKFELIDAENKASLD